MVSRAVENAVRYKDFYVIVQVKLDTGRRFDVIGQIRRIEDETQLARTWAVCKEFASEKAAYEFGLQKARAWIDEHGEENGPHPTSI